MIEELEEIQRLFHGHNLDENLRGVAKLDALILKEKNKPLSVKNLFLERFVVKHYSDHAHPSIKGNGFDGLVVGEYREQAEEFINLVNILVDNEIKRQRENSQHPTHGITAPDLQSVAQIGEAPTS